MQDKVGHGGSVLGKDVRRDAADATECLQDRRQLGLYVLLVQQLHQPLAQRLQNPLVLARWQNPIQSPAWRWRSTQWIVVGQATKWHVVPALSAIRDEG